MPDVSGEMKIENWNKAILLLLNKRLYKAYVCHALEIKCKRIVSYSFIFNDLLPDTFF